MSCFLCCPSYQILIALFVVLFILLVWDAKLSCFGVATISQSSTFNCKKKNRIDSSLTLFWIVRAHGNLEHPVQFAIYPQCPSWNGRKGIWGCCSCACGCFQEIDWRRGRKAHQTVDTPTEPFAAVWLRTQWPESYLGPMLWSEIFESLTVLYCRFSHFHSKYWSQPVREKKTEIRFGWQKH